MMKSKCAILTFLFVVAAAVGEATASVAVVEAHF